MQNRYTVTQFDVCSPGFERLRSQNEFLLVAYPRNKQLRATMQELIDDIDSCMRPDDFDFDACRAAVRQAFKDNGTQYAALLECEDWREHNRAVERGECEGIVAFLYIRDNMEESE